MICSEMNIPCAEQGEHTAQTEEVRSKLMAACQDLAAERRKVAVAQSGLSRLLQEFHHLQPVLQDTRRLRETATNLCNKAKAIVSETKYF